MKSEGFIRQKLAEFEKMYAELNEKEDLHDENPTERPGMNSEEWTVFDTLEAEIPLLKEILEIPIK